MINPESESDDVGRRVVCHKVREKDGKKMKTFMAKGVIKSIEERALYEKEDGEINPGKIAVTLDGKTKPEDFIREQLDWEPMDIVLKEFIDTEQAIICSVTKVEKPHLKIKSCRFECPSCGTILRVLQVSKKFREPSRCSCGRRGGFKCLEKDIVDAQEIVIMQKNTLFEFKANIEGKELIDFLKNTDDKNFLNVTGFVRAEYPNKLTKGDYFIEVTNIELKIEEKPAFLK